MALPGCKRCGKKDPQRMHGLMSLWFGPLVEFEADLGYFYLCPSCHDEFIVPELERIQNRILELHPAAQRHLDELESADGQQASGDDDAASAPDDGSGSDAAGEVEESVAEDPAGEEDPDGEHVAAEDSVTEEDSTEKD